MACFRKIYSLLLLILIGCAVVEKDSSNVITLYFNEMFSLIDLQKYFSISVDTDNVKFSKPKPLKAVSTDLPSPRDIPEEFYKLLGIIGKTDSHLRFVDISPDKSWVSGKSLFFPPNKDDWASLYCANPKSNIIKKYEFAGNCYFSKDSKKAYISDIGRKYIELDLENDKILSSMDEVEGIVLSACRKYLFFMKENRVNILDVSTGVITKGDSYRYTVYDSGIINDRFGYFMTHRSYKIGPTELYLIDFQNHNIHKYPYRIRESFIVFPW